MPAPPGPTSPSFPSLGQAVLLSLGVIVFQVAWIALLAAVFAVTLRGSFEAGMLLNPWNLAAMNLLAMGLVLFFGLRPNRESAASFFAIRGFEPKLLPAIVTTSVGLAVVLSETDNIIVELMRALRNFAGTADPMKLRAYPLGGLLLLVVVAPLTEEYLFRGLILRGLLGRHRATLAVWLSALLFGLVHANLPQLFLGVVIGAFFGWWYVSTRSVGPGMIGHAIFNSVAYCAARFPDTWSPLGINPAGGVVVHQPLWVTGGGLALVGLGALWFKQIAKLRPPPVEIPAPPPLDEPVPPVLEDPVPPVIPPETAIPQFPDSPAS